jgi:hypothetical protein
MRDLAELEHRRLDTYPVEVLGINVALGHTATDLLLDLGEFT